LIENQQHIPTVDQLDTIQSPSYREHLEQRQKQQRVGNEIGRNTPVASVAEPQNRMRDSNEPPLAR